MDELAARLLSFERLLSGAITRILYYVLLALIILGGILAMVEALMKGQFLSFLLAPFGVILAILALRVACEICIVLFRISDDLAAIRRLSETGESGKQR